MLIALLTIGSIAQPSDSITGSARSTGDTTVEYDIQLPPLADTHATALASTNPDTQTYQPPALDLPTVPEQALSRSARVNRPGLRLKQRLRPIAAKGALWGKRLLLAGACAALGFYLFQRLSSRLEQKRFLTTTRLSIMNKEVQRACRCIERSCALPELDTAMVCAEIITGPAYLEALFVRELGMSVGDFIEQVRVNRAKVLLRSNPHLEDLELAQKVGFATPEILSELFKRLSGADLAAFRAHPDKPGRHA